MTNELYIYDYIHANFNLSSDGAGAALTFADLCQPRLSSTSQCIELSKKHRLPADFQRTSIGLPSTHHNNYDSHIQIYTAYTWC